MNEGKIAELIGQFANTDCRTCNYRGCDGLELDGNNGCPLVIAARDELAAMQEKLEYYRIDQIETQRLHDQQLAAMQKQLAAREIIIKSDAAEIERLCAIEKAAKEVAAINPLSVPGIKELIAALSTNEKEANK